MLSANSFVSNNSSTVAKSAQKSKQLNNTAVIRPVLTVQEKLAQDSPSLPPQVSLFSNFSCMLLNPNIFFQFEF